jgi:hypothetical protein
MREPYTVLYTLPLRCTSTALQRVYYRVEQKACALGVRMLDWSWLNSIVTNSDRLASPIRHTSTNRYHSTTHPDRKDHPMRYTRIPIARHWVNNSNRLINLGYLDYGSFW